MQKRADWTESIFIRAQNVKRGKYAQIKRGGKSINQVKETKLRKWFV